MDDNDVCPLCCEELDISDRQFFPCKCGYQVCMWCWHRIRESESGLCPACRTPYGDDPHEFSAVDMEEVVKANKEKAAAEKRERERMRHLQHQNHQLHGVTISSSSGGGGGGGISSTSSVGSSSSHYSSGDRGGGASIAGNSYHSTGSGCGGIISGGGMHDIDNNSHGSGGMISSYNNSNSTSNNISMLGGKPLDPPKDRNQLANMRVIRRNLVYAVGLPPSIATEETLRKPEYFGEYGKISKIVLNRNHNGNGDPRRASASAYVTFFHKEDTLACILALDGFYLDGRNIRASYGTSKYCSAFIKSVRCNNPDCTYLHQMGEAEDTFTKQEIQAGYVTSGRDVLAKQQQQSHTNGRKKIGGGGPSGTGTAPSNPVFPPPCYDETVVPKHNSSQSSMIEKTTAPLYGGVTSINRSSTIASSAFPSSSSGGSVSISSVLGHSKITRSVSASSSMTPSQASSYAAAEKLSRQQEQLRRLHPQNNKPNSSHNVQKSSSSKPTSSTLSSTSLNSSSVSPNSSTGSGSATTTTAASVVVSGPSSHSVHTIPPPAHTTLTSLTPLKRSSSMPMPSSASKEKNTNVTNTGTTIPGKGLPISNKISSSGSSNKLLDNSGSMNNNNNTNNNNSRATVGEMNTNPQMQLQSNLPVQLGLNTSSQASFFNQRKESVAANTKQQGERTVGMRNNSYDNSSNQNHLSSKFGLPSSEKTYDHTIKSSAAPTNTGAHVIQGSTGSNFVGGHVLLGRAGGENNNTTIIGNTSNSLGFNSNNSQIQRDADNLGKTNDSFLANEFMPGLPSGRDTGGSTLIRGNKSDNTSNSLFVLNSSGGTKLRNFPGETDTNDLSFSHNEPRIRNGNRSNGNTLFSHDNLPKQQQNHLNLSAPFQSGNNNERWKEKNEGPSGLPSSYRGGSSSLFGSSPFASSSSGGGGIWGNDGMVGGGASSMSVLPSMSPGRAPSSASGISSFASNLTNMSPVGLSRSNYSENYNNDRMGGVRSTLIGGSSNNNGGRSLGKNPFANDSGSSTLASMLGIDLPTGSGSLRETNFSSSNSKNSQMPGSSQNESNSLRMFNAAPFSGYPTANHESLWDNKPQNKSNNVESLKYFNANNNRGGIIERSSSSSGNSPPRHMLGGTSVRANSAVGPVGSYNTNNSSNSNNDIALLQSLLPGVHITSGNAHQPAAPMSNVSSAQVPMGWNSSAPNRNSSRQVIGRPSPNEHVSNMSSSSKSSMNAGDTWGSVSGLYSNSRNVHQGMSTGNGSIW